MSEKPQLCMTLPALVVVSGTASGLGTCIAKQLVDCGVTTIGVDIAPQPDGLNNRLYVHMQGDVSQDKVWAAVGDEIRKTNPASIGLVTSAAMLEVGTILEFDRAALEKTMAVNFVGTALAIRAALPHMIERCGGSIVAVASVNGGPSPSNSSRSTTPPRAPCASSPERSQWITPGRGSAPMFSVPAPCSRGCSSGI